MIPFSYNMVDMGGIDLAEANHTTVPGIYEKIQEAVNACGDILLYNWKFADIEIAPSYYSILNQQGSFLINGMIQVTELDEVTVLGIEPPPPPIEPVEPLVATENGVYEAEAPVSGFNPVTVNVNVEPPIGFSSFIISNKTGDRITGWFSSRSVVRIIDNVKLVPASYRFNNGYVAGTFYSLVDYNLSDVVTGDYLQKVEIDISSVGIGHDILYAYGGTAGAGLNGNVMVYPSNSNVQLVMPPQEGQLYAHGPINAADFGTAFNAMSTQLKEEFWRAVLQTI